MKSVDAQQVRVWLSSRASARMLRVATRASTVIPAHCWLLLLLMAATLWFH